MRFNILRKSDQTAVASVRVNEEHRASTGNDRKDRRWASVRLWIAQVLVATVFLLAGGMKLTMPLELLVQQSHMPGLFMRFIAVCEVLGALGLILPGLLRIRPGLTPLAAAGLVIIMIGATLITVLRGQVAPALPPFVLGLLASYVAYGRWRLVPLPRREASRHSVLQPVS
jgi:uncharacterized membrane protein YphA (DoxX/SURF4 family)